MCSVSLKEVEYLNGMSKTLSSVTCPISSNSNCPDYCRKDVTKSEKIEINTVIQEDEDLSLSNYLDKNIFGLLIPALKETLSEASKWDALRVQKCRFNGLDYIAQILWNRNPRRSKTYSPPLDVFDIPPFKEYLRLHPRPYYPKSWLWSKDEAALRIQKYVRGWLVRKRADIQEMRQFWKKVAGKSLFVKKESCILQLPKVLGMFH
ncbi:IQ domain-containing protein K [Xylocopa sonorina]|uniref:IQ domain-containing protein K n=1 Tax=Xylocopa sonorina TaxID=1818115 RepID=UPI00403ACD2E